MGFKSIDSEEKIGQVDVARGEPPKHVPERHEKCAYYLWLAPNHMAHEHEGLLISADGDSPGAWYSEDYVRELRVAAQQVIRFYGMVGKEGSIGHRALLKLEELASDGS